jgi:hypothetical protein
MADPVYHLELRAFPHVARVFNLDRASLDARFLAPWTAGDAIAHDDRRWPAEKTKLTVLLGPPVEAQARGLGRGWGEVTRSGQDVTEAVLAEIRRGADARPEVEALQSGLLETAGRADLTFADAVALAAAAQPGWRVSEQLALAEQAVWEMLHRETLQLLDAEDRPIPRERWQEIVLTWGSWSGVGGPAVRLRAG